MQPVRIRKKTGHGRKAVLYILAVSLITVSAVLWLVLKPQPVPDVGTDETGPELTLAADTEREGGRDEEYRIVFADKDGTYPLRMTQGEWEKYSVGDAVVLTVSPSGNVQEIKKK